MEKEKKAEFRDFTDGSSNGEKKYKNKVVFLHKSKKGKHLYAFDNDGAFAIANEILMNISDVEALIAGEDNKIKVSILEKEETKDDLSSR